METLLLVCCIVNSIGVAVNYWLWRRLRDATILGINQTLSTTNEMCKASTHLDTTLLDLCKALAESVKLLDRRITTLEKAGKSGLSLGDILDKPS